MSKLNNLIEYLFFNLSLLMENNANLIALILVIAIIQILINIFSDNNIKIFDYQMLSWKIDIYSTNTNIIYYNPKGYEKKLVLNIIKLINNTNWLFIIPIQFGLSLL